MNVTHGLPLNEFLEMVAKQSILEEAQPQPVSTECVELDENGYVPPFKMKLPGFGTEHIEEVIVNVSNDKANVYTIVVNNGDETRGTDIVVPIDSPCGKYYINDELPPKVNIIHGILSFSIPVTEHLPTEFPIEFVTE